MATISIDTFATTNPAFCGLIIYSFVEGFAKKDAGGVPFPYIFLPIPIVLTDDIAQTFHGTNYATGLLTWLARAPEVTVGMNDRIQVTADITRQALLFGSRYGVFAISDTGRISIKPKGLRKKSFAPTGNTSVDGAFRLAKQFGSWLGQAGTTETVLAALGVNR